MFFEVLIFSQYQACPRIRHLEAAYHIFAYMKSHMDMEKLPFDSRRPEIFDLAAD